MFYPEVLLTPRKSSSLPPLLSDTPPSKVAFAVQERLLSLACQGIRIQPRDYSNDTYNPEPDRDFDQFVQDFFRCASCSSHKDPVLSPTPTLKSRKLASKTLNPAPDSDSPQNLPFNVDEFFAKEERKTAPKPKSLVLLPTVHPILCPVERSSCVTTLSPERTHLHPTLSPERSSHPSLSRMAPSIDKPFATKEQKTAPRPKPLLPLPTVHPILCPVERSSCAPTLSPERTHLHPTLSPKRTAHPSLSMMDPSMKEIKENYSRPPKYPQTNPHSAARHKKGRGYRKWHNRQHSYPR